MYAYVVRRLLWMVPTLLGILVITFVVSRFQGDSFASVLKEQAAGGPGERMARAAAEVKLEGALQELVPTGNLLPSVLNVRGFTDKADVVRMLERTENRPGNDVGERERVTRVLWTGGHLYVEPLAEILADDSLQRLHGPASRAFTLCAYVPLDASVRAEEGDERFRFLQDRNRERDNLHIRFENREGVGYVTDETTDSRYREKRAALLAFWMRHNGEFVRTAGMKWGAVLGETGFVHFLTRLSTGRLYSHKQQQYVFTLMADRWHVTFLINLLSIIIAWGVSIPLGIRSARRLGTLEDRATTTGLLALWSLPSFFVGTVFLALLCTDSGSSRAPFPNRGLLSPNSLWLSGWQVMLDWMWHAFLPLVVLTYASFTVMSRYMRGSLLDQLDADYVRTARAKGANEDSIVYRHAVPNSLITMITLGSGLLADLFGSSLFVEKIFSIQGLSLLLYDATLAKDIPLIMGSTVVSVVLLLVGILIADILYAVVDPRIRNRYA